MSLVQSRQIEKQCVRGSRLAPPPVVSEMIRQHGASDIVMASVPMVTDFELKHMLIHGTIGSGKEQIFNSLIEQIRRRGDSAIIFDQGCLFTRLFYQANSDVILNPFDQRCAPWDLWKEASSEPDLENMAQSFSIRQGMQEMANTSGSHFLFISSHAEQHAALRPLIAMWLSIASTTLLSLGVDDHQRIWFICDELPALPQLPGLGESITEARPFGGCFVLGIPSFAQLQRVYGRALAQEMVDLLNTRFFFRSPSADVAAWVSQELGQEVSPADIMDMADLSAYLRVPAPVPITPIPIPFEKRDPISPGCLLREMPLSSGQSLS